MSSIITENLPILVILFPLFGALLMTGFGWFNKRYCMPIAVLSLFGSFVCSVQLLTKVVHTGTVRYFLGGWLPPFGIEYVVDHLNGIVLVLVSFVAFISAIYANKSIERESPDKVYPYYVLSLLLVTGLLGMTITGDAFNLYVLLEISALTSYALIAIGKGRAYMATFNYLILGSIGACFYLLGVGYLFIKSGTLNMSGVSAIITELHTSQAILIAFIFMMVGIWIKMGFFPFHGWLPNAYTFAPTASSCLIAPLMTKVSVYIMIRIMYYIFSAQYVFEVLNWQPLIMGMSVLAILAGSFFALLQRDLKKMLTYIIVAEVGYMVGGAWLGNSLGLTGATYHIIADAIMTSCLFMAVGCVIYQTKSSDFDALKGVFRKMPITMLGFLIGAFSMIGIPPTCGFFSKWYLILGAIEAQQWPYMAALLISSLVNAILFFRLIEIGFFSDTHKKLRIKEAPLSMLVPLLVMAGLVIVIGLYTQDIVTYFLNDITAAVWPRT